MKLAQAHLHLDKCIISPSLFSTTPFKLNLFSSFIILQQGYTGLTLQTMLSFKSCKLNYCLRSTTILSTPFSRPAQLQTHRQAFHHGRINGGRKSVTVKMSQGEEKEKKTFLSLEEAGLVEMSGLSTHERFLCRLTISSLNLLRVISEQEGIPVEELNAGRLTDWFVKDKLKREQNLDSAVLQWDDSGFQM